jgi:hypothetical protein
MLKIYTRLYYNTNNSTAQISKFFVYLSSHIMALESTQPLKETSTRNLTGDYAWPVLVNTIWGITCKKPRGYAVVSYYITHANSWTKLNIIQHFFRLCSIQGPPLWSSGQSSWLQIQRPGFDSRRYQIFWEVVGMEQGPLSFVSTVEKLLEGKRSGSGLENWDYSCREASRWPCGTLYPQKLALISLTSGGRSVGIVHSRIQTMDFSFFSVLYKNLYTGAYTHKHNKRMIHNF